MEDTGKWLATEADFEKAVVEMSAGVVAVKVRGGGGNVEVEAKYHGGTSRSHMVEDEVWRIYERLRERMPLAHNLTVEASIDGSHHGFIMNDEYYKSYKSKVAPAGTVEHLMIGLRALNFDRFVKKVSIDRPWVAAICPGSTSWSATATNAFRDESRFIVEMHPCMDATRDAMVEAIQAYFRQHMHLDKHPNIEIHRPGLQVEVFTQHAVHGIGDKIVGYTAGRHYQQDKQIKAILSVDPGKGDFSQGVAAAMPWIDPSKGTFADPKYIKEVNANKRSDEFRSDVARVFGMDPNTATCDQLLDTVRKAWDGESERFFAAEQHAQRYKRELDLARQNEGSLRDQLGALRRERDGDRQRLSEAFLEIDDLKRQLAEYFVK